MSNVVASKNRIRWKINGLDFSMDQSFDVFYLSNGSKIRSFLLNQMYNKDYEKAEDLVQDICIRIYQSLYNEDGSLNMEKLVERQLEQSELGYDVELEECFNHLVKNIIWSHNSNDRVKESRRIEIDYVGAGNEDDDDGSVEALSHVIMQVASSHNSFEHVRVEKFYEDLRDSLGSEKEAQVFELVTLGYSSNEIMELLNLDCYTFYSIISKGKVMYNNILCTHFTAGEMNIQPSSGE